MQDNQFSALGLVMIAHLSHAYQIIGFQSQMGLREASSSHVTDRPPNLSSSSLSEDLGVAMTRTPTAQTTERADSASTSNMTSSTKHETKCLKETPAAKAVPGNDPLAVAHSASKRAKHTKGKGPIDDLFHGLM